MTLGSVLAPTPRLVRLCNQATILRSRSVTPITPSWPAKDPSEVLTYGADFTTELGTDTIAAAAVAIILPPGGAVLTEQPTWTAGVVSLQLGGGTDQQPATIILTVNTECGETITRAITLPIVSQIVLPSYPQPVLAAPDVLACFAALPTVQQIAGNGVVWDDGGVVSVGGYEFVSPPPNALVNAANAATISGVLQTLPTSLPGNGGPWVDGGTLAVAPGMTLPPPSEFVLAVFNAFFATLSTTQTAAGQPWNNGGQISFQEASVLGGTTGSSGTTAPAQTVLAQITSVIATLPTTMPSTPGQLWLNGNVVQLS